MTVPPIAGAVDLLVIGAGVTGAAAAISAARAPGKNLSILLVDHSPWPREKVCGCCLGAIGVASLSRLGFKTCEIPHVRLDRVRISTRGGATFDLPHAGGAVMTRSVLDASLVNAAMAVGVSFRSRCSATVIAQCGGVWRVRLGNDTWLARAVIVADGLGGRSLSMLPRFAPQVARAARVGIGVHVPGSSVPQGIVPAGTVHLAHGQGGYAGLVRCGDGSLNVAAALDPESMRALRGPLPMVQKLLNEAQVGLALDPTTRVAGTPLLTRRRAAIGGPGLIIAGDAAGYVEPFTGEGMTWALVSGERAGFLAAHAIGRGAAALEALGSEWGVWYRRELAPMQRACRSIRPLLQSPALVSGIASIAQRSRGVRWACSAISRRVTGGTCATDVVQTTPWRDAAAPTPVLLETAG